MAVYAKERRKKLTVKDKKKRNKQRKEKYWQNPELGRQKVKARRLKRVMKRIQENRQ